jgi:hypothetical protein
LPGTRPCRLHVRTGQPLEDRRQAGHVAGFEQPAVLPVGDDIDETTTRAGHHRARKGLDRDQAERLGTIRGDEDDVRLAPPSALRSTSVVDP